LVDDLQVWSSGRTVQCDECGRRWRAAGGGVRPGPVEQRTESPVAERAPSPEPFRPAEVVSSEADPGPAPSSGGERTEPSPGAADTLFIPVRPKSRGRPERRRARTIPVLVLVGWGLGLLLLVALAWAVARREDVVRAVPAAAGAYSAVGLAAAPPAGPASGSQ
jgi:hypothetical protein